MLRDQDVFNQFLKSKIQQQEALAELGQLALSSPDLGQIVAAAVEIVAGTLNAPLVEIMEVLPDKSGLLLKAGCGWKEGYVGHTTVDDGHGSLEGFTVFSGEPVVVPDVKADKRFETTLVQADNGAVSFMTAIIGKKEAPFGVIGAGTRHPRHFTEDDVNFLRSVANVLAEADNRVRAEQELHRQRMLLRSVLHSLDDGVIVTDEVGLPLIVNVAARKMIGIDKVTIPKDKWSEVYGLHDPHTMELFATEELPLVKAMNGETVAQTEMFVKNKNRTEGVWVGISGMPVDPRAGLSGGGIVVLRDITARKKFEKQLQEAANDLCRSNQELEQFAYVASHDLQEPLRGVAGCLQILEKQYKDKLDDTARELIRHSVDGAVRMRALINDLLALSRVGTRSRKLEPTNCLTALQTAMKNLEIAIKENDALITHENLPTLAADGSQLTQLFQNLINNALKFHGKERPEIKVGAQMQDGQWQFFVADNGIGFEQQYADRIFLPFKRLHTREEYPGTGIGLAICKKIVERHGGEIWAKSQPGAGTTFFFTIPQKGEQNE